MNLNYDTVYKNSQRIDKPSRDGDRHTRWEKSYKIEVDNKTQINCWIHIYKNAKIDEVKNKENLALERFKGQFGFGKLNLKQPKTLTVASKSSKSPTLKEISLASYGESQEA